MMIKWKGSPTWLLWTAMLLATSVVAVIVSSGPEISQAASPSADVEIGKTINVPSVEPGQAPAPLYTVTFTNPNPAEVILDRITDTLPSGFEFISMAPGTDWTEGPVDSVEPEIVWAGPIPIPAAGHLSLVYSVYVEPTVPPRTAPYVNTVRAMAHDGTRLGPASAKLLVGAADLGVEKQASPTRVLSGGLVTYTVQFSNSGQLTGTLALITDTLDPSLTFVAMAAGSDVTVAPHQIAGALVWDDPRQVPPQQTLTLKYRVRTSSDPGWSWPSNRVEADVGQETIAAGTTIVVGPERGRVFLPAVFKKFEYARLSVTKSAFPAKVTTMPGRVVTYTVTIKNEGDTTGTLKTVYDTLPAGFTFSAMAAGSDIATNPSGVTGKITWSGTWSMAPGSQKKVIYRVIPSQTEGQYTNYANVTAEQALVPMQPAAAIVTVEKGMLLEDHFEDGIGRWTPFTNYWRVKDPAQWYWGSTDGVSGSGAATHDATIGANDAHDALLMYLGEGAEDWTDYRVEVKLKLRGGINDEGDFDPSGGSPVGLWVRGQYEPSTIRAQWVTGYYVVIGGDPNRAKHYVRLAQLQTTTDCWDQACNNPDNLYNFNNSHVLVEVKQDGTFDRSSWYTLAVEVRGDRIMAWVNGQLAIDFVDPKEPFLKGTVGFKTYKSKTVSFDDLIVTPLNP